MKAMADEVGGSRCCSCRLHTTSTRSTGGRFGPDLAAYSRAMSGAAPPSQARM